MDKDEYFLELSKRYRGVEPEALVAVMCPLLVPIRSIDRNVHKVAGQSHWRASFSLELDEVNSSVVQVGRTGKFVPNAYHTGEAWREIAKGRITDLDVVNGIAHGEIYNGSTKSKLEEALRELNTGDFLEIDQYGASAKILRIAGIRC